MKCDCCTQEKFDVCLYEGDDIYLCEDCATQIYNHDKSKEGIPW